ncbi:MAG: dihydrolipoyl dehydrogenase family protein [Anaerosomatales bacterium]|nr:NAD(P)/FAD-dependent oxidoreductase [Coriobacteriia bacterium]
MASDKRVVVIGSGAAGTAAARTLAAAGWSVTVVERDRVGGTCLWTGCMPKKALYTSARARRSAARAEMFGLEGIKSFDWQTVLAWKWHSQETYAGDQESGLAERGITLLKGDAHFVSTDALEVDGRRLTFDHAVIATGSRPEMPPVEGIELADTSADALSYREPPSSLLVVGGGFVGIELATVYASFGTEVTIITSGPRPLGMLDEEVASVALRRLERMGVTLRASCRLHGLAGTQGAATARFVDGEGLPHEGTWKRVLVATGRAPALEELDLQAAGVEVDGHGRIVLDTSQRTTNPRIWAAGDAAGGMMQTPIANYQGRTVATSIHSGTALDIDTSAIPTCLFTTPQVAQVGLTEAQARAAGIEISVGRATFDFLGAAVIEDERDGLVKLIFSASDGRLVGAHIAGPTASDLIYAMAVAMRCGATRDTLGATVGIHPAYCESLNWAAG